MPIHDSRQPFHIIRSTCALTALTLLAPSGYEDTKGSAAWQAAGLKSTPIESSCTLSNSAQRTMSTYSYRLRQTTLAGNAGALRHDWAGNLGRRKLNS